MGKMLRLASWSNQPKSVLCISTFDKPKAVSKMWPCFGVKAPKVGCYNLSISDLLMDSLIKNDSIDLLYMVMQGSADESIRGKSSHT